MYEIAISGFWCRHEKWNKSLSVSFSGNMSDCRYAYNCSFVQPSAMENLTALCPSKSHLHQLAGSMYWQWPNMCRQVLAGSRFAEGSLCQCSLLFIYVCFSIFPRTDILREKEQRDNVPLRSGLIPGKFCAKWQESHRCIPPETMKLCVLGSCGGAWDGRCASGTLGCVCSITMAFLRHKFG